ncbi:MAG: GGDEF domain-containing protein [Chloroflexota bacterium]
MLKRLLGDILTDLGPLEGDYRAANLKGDIRQGILYMLVASLGILTLFNADVLPPQARPPFTWATAAGYAVVTVLFGALLYNTTKVRVYDRLMTAWLLLTLLFRIVLDFITSGSSPLAYLDILLIFITYLASPLSFRNTAAMAVGFSVSLLYINHFIQTAAGSPAVPIFAHLTAHLLGWLAHLQMQTHRRKSFQAFIDEKDAKEMVAFLANIDPLTKSLTRRQFLNIAESEFRRFQRYQRPLSIMILDADHFKAVNDTHGHHAGDLVLRSLSLTALEQKRAQDTFGRLGGEEFGLLMPETTLDKARVVAERIRLVWEASPVKLDGELIRSTISIGLAQAEPTDRSLEDLLRRADQMLYKAKANGRNRVES